MVPDADLQLQAVIKALSDIVRPAVDAGNTVAVEQLHLSIATLGLLRQQLPMMRRFTRVLLQDAIAMGDEVAGQLDQSTRESLDFSLAGARDILTDPSVEVAAIEQARTALNEAIAAAIAACDGQRRVALEPLIIAMSKPSIGRFRSWFAGSGFEPDMSKIQPIDSLLG